MPFQKQVNQELAYGVPGTFASNNPDASAVPPEGAYVAGTGGCTIAAFGWDQGDGTVLNKPSASNATAAPTGYVFNDRSAWISDIYDEATMVMPQGYMVDLKTAGDYFAVASTAATAGQKVFASTTDGTLSTGAAGATVTGAIETNFYVTLGGGVGETITISTWSRG